MKQANISNKGSPPLSFVITVMMFLLMLCTAPLAMANETTPGILQGTGTSFALTDSDWLNLTVNSTTEIDLYLHSYPTVIDMIVSAAPGAQMTTDIVIGGLQAETNYWHYLDDSIEPTDFITDLNGRTSFSLDLTAPKSIRILPKESTFLIDATGGDCPSIGIWDAANLTCTLTTDVNTSILVHTTGVTLDGAGHRVNLGPADSVHIIGDSHTMKNLEIHSMAEGPGIPPKGEGLHLNYAYRSTINNISISNRYLGLKIYQSAENQIGNVTVSNAAIGLEATGHYHKSICTPASLMNCGTTGNLIKDSTFTGRQSPAALSAVEIVHGSRNNTFSGNTFADFNIGVQIWGYYCLFMGLDHYCCPAGNTFYHNNFINIAVDDLYEYYAAANTHYHLPLPIGGNYYENYDEPIEGCYDGSGDGFCDDEYPATSMYGGYHFDNFPWTDQSGWVNRPPTADAGGPYLVATGATISLDGSRCSDPDGDTLCETWTCGGGVVSGCNYTAGSMPGIYDVELVVNDGMVDSAPATSSVVVYDPSSSFVTGGGWFYSPTGAYRPAPDLSGKATFGFVTKYLKRSTSPVGQTEFQFQTADLNFHSTSYEWLVVAGAKAQFKGMGTVNGQPGYGFMITALDEALTASSANDRFRIKIWDTNNADVVLYDNELGESTLDADPTTAIEGGSIVISKPKGK